jgi:hypothetical protein
MRLQMRSEPIVGGMEARTFLNLLYRANKKYIGGRSNACFVYSRIAPPEMEKY